MRIERITTDLKGNNLRHDIAFGITSLTSAQATPEQLLKLNRRHWSIENELHYVRDVTFDEDRCWIAIYPGLNFQIKTTFSE